MNSLFQPAQYEEDQQYAHEILTFHVLSRGYAMGAFVSAIPVYASRFTRYRLSLPKSATIGSLIGVGAMTLAIRGRMNDKTEIEWQDRSWRILQNQSQIKTDWAMLGGAMSGAIVGISRRSVVQRPVWMIAGGASLGAAAGLLLGMTTVRPAE